MNALRIMIRPSPPPLMLLLMLLLLLAAIVQVAPGEARRYIVRMRSYANVQEQRRIVQKVLGKNPSCEWSFAKRQVGAHMDTDFCVIEGCSALREELRGSKAILDVHQDHAGKRYLKGGGWHRNGVKFSHVDGRKLASAVSAKDGSVDFDGNVPAALRADELWRRGIDGTGIKVAVLDSGLLPQHRHFGGNGGHYKLTDEPGLEDEVFNLCDGIVGGSDDDALASRLECVHMRVFTSDQISFTSWFLDAMNYAIASGVDVLNLSIGGPDPGCRLRKNSRGCSQRYNGVSAWAMTAPSGVPRIALRMSLL